MWNGVASNQNILKRLDTANKVAGAFNSLAGIELLTGHELEAAVQNGTVGMSPQRRGRNISVPDDEFKAFCAAVFTYSAIQQINSVERSNRSELMSLVGDVLNAK